MWRNSSFVVGWACIHPSSTPERYNMDRRRRFSPLNQNETLFGMGEGTTIAALLYQNSLLRGYLLSWALPPVPILHSLPDLRTALETQIDENHFQSTVVRSLYANEDELLMPRSTYRPTGWTFLFCFRRRPYKDRAIDANDTRAQNLP